MDEKSYFIDVNNRETFRLMNQNGVRQCVSPSPTLHNASWDSILSPDGKLYLSLCSELTTSEYAKLAVYDADKNSIEELHCLRNYIFSNPRFIRDSKIHTCLAWMNDGRLLMMTHTTDKSPEHPAWMPLAYYSHPWEGFPGSSLLIYDPATGKLENLGIPVHRETLYGGAYDKLNNIYYAIGFLKGHLYAIDLNDRSVKDYGQVAERASYRLAVGSDGNIYFTTRNGILQRVNVRSKKVENLRIQLPFTKEVGRFRPYLSYAVNGMDGKLYMAGMHDEHLSCYDPKTNEFTVVGDYMGVDTYARGDLSNHYLGCMAFDRENVLYYVICGPKIDKEEDYKMPAMLMRWDFLAGGKPERLGLAGTSERVITTSCTMQIDRERDRMFIVGTNHANDGPDVTVVALSVFRDKASEAGPIPTDPLVFPNNDCYTEHAQSIHEGKCILAENPTAFTFGAVLPVQLWQQFTDEDIQDSAVVSLRWEGDRLIAVCGCERFYEFVIGRDGSIASRTEVERPAKKAEESIANMPYYPGRQYKSTVACTAEMAGGRQLVATEDGLLAIRKDEAVFALGPGWINGRVNAMTATADGTRVYGVAGDRDDFSVVFSYDDVSGLRWLGGAAFDGSEYGNHSAAYLTAIALDEEGTALAIGSGERMGCVYLYQKE